MAFFITLFNNNHMPTLIIVNPKAGRVRDIQQVERLIIDRFGRENEGFELVETCTAYECIGRVRSAPDAGFDKLLVAGGDGSVHICLQGIDFERLAMGILPLGSGNDIYRSFGIRITPRAALDNFFAGEARADVGEVSGIYFLNTAGMGLDGWTLHVRRHTSGPFARNYIYLFLKTLRMLRPLDFTITIDGATIRRKALWVVAANNAYIGGGMKIAPDSTIDDGLFDVLIVGNYSRLALVYRMPRIFKGTHVKMSRVEVIRGRDVRIECEEEIPCGIDGELHDASPLDIKMHHGKLRLRGRLTTPGG